MGRRGTVLKSAATSGRQLRSATKATSGTANNVTGVLRRSKRVSAGGKVVKPPPKPAKVPKFSKTIVIDSKKYPESAAHIKDAQKTLGKPSILTIDRTGAKQNRKDSLRGVPTQPKKDRDEYPPAVFKEGGSGASIKHIASGDNRGSGAVIGQAIKGLPNGAVIQLIAK
ncbi:NucA/NucB deoxyribonuclease domain-containing protein [Saccharothrix coeruleofusca]|uniref:Deoxyribonuclease NucA/NucB domain-containing protein n=1 Tax=Saccharothrix coeruleofusca TaxID=33919 RepID=A0A918AKJ2_9PSEU|nr:NucA/NucB deoxyribonuclease domain-containing protein [Saccharothrix coeruleofusca]MBP2336520.1 hypothetical protein [Saccharothrix coeruleofusca]GGP52439.1 hypothetical protein GCM10010185_25680 [Saccharothrix coeruleofusca]